MMQIKAFSQKYNVKEDTIRFYEKIGLLQPKRKPNGYRQYDEQCASQLKMIIVLKQFGFSLDEIAQLMSLEQQEITRNCNETAISLFDLKIEELINKVRFYEKAIQTLQETKKLMLEESYEANQQEIKQAIDRLFNSLKGEGEHG